ncbi:MULTISPECIES: NADH-quinone oxidoreductase subunit M [unclassified Halomonas]|uniref:NADH-quinone oxidoreductase subunit M n=1 Tax=unclassified Halomonas TaxID=2609666 RepID=UPI002887C3B8|nr:MULTISPECIES: NADH-quinone oxidoreductase subunit M [unclassified Halomonas]MDT0500839.1 NADH-quinone oxidoreductase subunit M [Halomonas sp. PAR7]MDT0512575.1 NADH-quinone oxidoreductase subunit M [Halomonas sp. LES1]MDT0592843.1 NADH-quinone oxidoreductase subunit M [Halomonas sp. PAR8]
MILVWLIVIPFVGGILCWQAERLGDRPTRWIALITMLIELAIPLWLWGQLDFGLPALDGEDPRWALEFRAPWIPRFGIDIHLALDGLSLALIALTGFLGVLAVVCSWKEIVGRIGFFHLNLLWILGGVIGVFLVMDLFLFFFFWEMMLVPMYFLIALWGHSGSRGRTRIGAATKFFIYTQASGLLMLAAILGLVFAHHANTGDYSFSYEVLLGTSLSPTLAFWLMLGFFIAFAVKLPVVPFHGWLPNAHAQAPTAGSVDLAGILLKTGAYGMLRFALPLFPEASQAFAPVAMGLGLLGIFYGAILACGQQDIKRFIAYTSIAHMGFVLIGIYSGSSLALQGVVVLMLAHAFSAAGLFILSGQLYERLHTRDMTLMGGLWGRLGSLPGFWLFFVAASLGMPTTANFVGEFMVLFGTFSTAPWVVVAASVGLVLAAVYSLILMQRVHYGPPRSDEPLAGLDTREFLMMLTILALVLWLGLYPQPLLDTTGAAMDGVQQLSEIFDRVPAGADALTEVR